MGSRGDFLETDEFDELIEDMGELPAFWHRKVGACPRCNDAVGGFTQRDPSCPNCHGTGEIYRVMTLPTANRLTGGKVIAVDATIHRGKVEEGDLRVVYSPQDYRLSDGDRFGFPTRRVTHYVLLKRGWEGAGGLTDLLDYGPLLSILHVYNGDEEVTSGFSISSGGYGITWDGGATTPSLEDNYLVMYEFAARYSVRRGGIRHRIRADDTETGFPNSVILKLDQLAPTDTAEGQS